MSWMSARRSCFDCGTMTECEIHTPLDELAIDEFERLDLKAPYGITECDAFQLGAWWGAAWMYAIIAMAQAIKNKHREDCHWDGHPWVDANANPRRCRCGYLQEARVRV